MVESDLVIYASPLYYWGFSAQMKALIDRCHCLYRGVCGSPEHTSFVEGQRQALIVTAADPYENNAELIQTSFQRILVYDKAHSAGELFVCNCTTPENLDDEIKTQAINFAKQLFEATTKPYSILIPGGAPNLVPK
jgi:NAD(P)H-dependent FMN reductase